MQLPLYSASPLSNPLPRDSSPHDSYWSRGRGGYRVQRSNQFLKLTSMSIGVSGHTLIELLIVLAFSFILALSALPNWQALIATAHMSTQVNQLIELFNFARYQALLSGKVVSVCPSSDGLHCSKNWSDGQIVFVDHAQTGQPVLAQDILRVASAISKQDQLSMQGIDQGYLQFTPLGILLQGRTRSFIYCPANHDVHFARAIIVSMTGRVRLSSVDRCS